MRRIGCIALGSMIAAVAALGAPPVEDFDRLPARISLESDKAVYHAGEEIKLTVTFFYEGGYRMKLYKDLSKSASLTVGSRGGAEHKIYFRNPTLKALNQSRIDRLYSNEPAGETCSQSPQILKREISGRVELSGKTIKVRFEGFGDFELNEPAEAEVSLHFWPANPSPTDSFEAGTNRVSIFFDR